MIKKYNKILFTTALFFLIVLFAFITNVEAKEFTLDELTEKVLEIQPDATYLYVIGNYAFSSEHTLTTQDTMLAARTIKVSENSGGTNTDPIYNEMTIAYLKGIIDDNWNLTGLEYESNVIGTTQEQETYDIKYIDYEEIRESVAVNELIAEVYATINTETSSNDKFEVSIEENDITVTVLDVTMNSVTALQGTGVATAVGNLLEAEGVGKVTISIPGTETKVEITAENIIEKIDELDALFTALAGTTNATAGDLAGKSIEVNIELADGYVTEDSTTFTVSFAKKETIEISKLVEDVYTTINTTTSSNDKFEVSIEENDITVTVLDVTMNSVTALQGTGVATAVGNLLDEESVEKVTISIPGTETKVEITAENIIEKIDELDALFTALAGTTNATAGDLAGKSIEVNIELAEGYITTEATTFTVSFGKKETIEVSKLVEDVYTTINTTTSSNDKFETSIEGNNITITVLDVTMNSVTALQGTGVATAAGNLLDEESVEKVTISIPGTETKVEITAENIIEKIDELNELFTTLAGTTSATAGDLAGKSIEVNIELAEGYTTTEATTFTVSFN